MTHGANDTRGARFAVARSLRQRRFVPSCCTGRLRRANTIPSGLITTCSSSSTRSMRRDWQARRRRRGRGPTRAIRRRSRSRCRNGAGRPTFFRWSTPTSSSDTACCTAIRPFEGIRVDLKDLRLQLEQEAMGKLIKLRQGVLASGNEGRAAARAACRERERDHDRLSRLSSDARREAAGRQRGVVGGGRASAPVSTQRLSFASFDMCAARRRSTSGDVSGVLAGYLRGMEQLVAYLDKYQAATPSP